MLRRIKDHTARKARLLVEYTLIFLVIFWAGLSLAMWSRASALEQHSAVPTEHAGSPPSR